MARFQSKNEPEVERNQFHDHSEMHVVLGLPNKVGVPWNASHMATTSKRRSHLVIGCI